MTEVYHETRGWEPASADATDRERPDEMSGHTRPDTEDPAADPTEGGSKVRPRTRAREADNQNSADGDESGGHSAMSGAMSTPMSATDSDDNTGPGGLARLKDTAARWGLDVAPPSFIKQGLPPIGDSREYARSGQQAPVTGPARVGAVAFDVITRPIRWVLRLADHLLARPGRTLIGLAFLIVVVRLVQAIEGLAVFFALIAGLLGIATWPIQWLMGIA